MLRDLGYGNVGYLSMYYLGWWPDKPACVRVEACECNDVCDSRLCFFWQCNGFICIQYFYIIPAHRARIVRLGQGFLLYILQALPSRTRDCSGLENSWHRTKCKSWVVLKSMCVAAFFGSVHFCFVCLLVVKDQHVLFLFFVFSYFCPYVVIRSSVIFFVLVWTTWKVSILCVLN